MRGICLLPEHPGHGIPEGNARKRGRLCQAIPAPPSFARTGAVSRPPSPSNPAVPPVLAMYQPSPRSPETGSRTHSVLHARPSTGPLFWAMLDCIQAMVSSFHFLEVLPGISLGLLLAGCVASATCADGVGETSSAPRPPPAFRTFGPDSPRNPDVVMAFGDSLTVGEIRPAFPDILAGLTGKTVANEGIHGSTAESGVGRASAVIAARNGSCMLILYGINDLLFGHSPREIAESLDCIVHVCDSWHVTPVLATYPLPIRRHAAFARGTLLLNETIRRLASARGIRLVDLEKAFMADGKPDPALYLEDGLHPSALGNKRIAREFAALF